MDLKVYLNSLRLRGYLAYEYNPFHNYLTEVDLYKKDGFIFPKGLAINKKNGELLNKINGKWVDKRGQIIENDIITESDSNPYAKAGSIIDFDTDKLNFDLEHPVDILILPSYDGSVNLILNDDKNIPRLINSRFSVREKNTYEIVDRIGENDTNIYNSKSFNKDSSLYFQYESNPTITYKGFIKGVLPVGSYCFYFTYCDADDNESDYIAETGIIPVFIGSDCDPNSIDGGIKNLISNKGIRLLLLNLDKSYNYLKVYYVRYFADYQQNRVSECKKIYKKFPINSDRLYLQITGNEESENIDPNILNISKFNPKSILTSAQCKNMLFFGNIIKNSDNYRELSDCALRIVPSIESKRITLPNNEYISSDIKYGYYSSENSYNNVGYFNLEFYRFGVVFIYNNGTLSNVYNTLGGDLVEGDTSLNINLSVFNDKSDGFLVRNYIKVDDEGWVKEDGQGSNINARGVCHFLKESVEENEILGVKFIIPQDVINYLKNDLGIRGLFFVRQKCVPNIIAQCFILPMDETLEAPVIKTGNTYKTECFLTLGSKWVSNAYNDRLYSYTKVGSGEDSISKVIYAGICPDFLLNQPYYNQIFNGSKFKLLPVTEDLGLISNDRFYKSNNNQTSTINKNKVSCIINSVTEDVPTVAIKDKIFRLNIGETEEAIKFKYAEIDKSTYNAGEDNYDAINNATNLVRGTYSPYLAIYSDQQLIPRVLYNIYLDLSLNERQEFQNRMDSSDSFYAISDRYNFEQLPSASLVCWRGDCFINNFTFRLNRNFNDPSLPNNDVIVDMNTWADNYKVEDMSKWTNILRSDINAVQMGSWITFKVRSAMNYALRSEDHSFVSEEALMGAPRSFYPRSKLMWRGENKMPDSYLFNDAYRASLGFKCYQAVNNINYIKDTFSNRILYSAIAIQDSFKNNYRESLSTYYRDYSIEYGSITKLVGFEGYLLVVFEHAIGIATVNERVLAGGGDGEPVFINTQNVLPEELTIISDTYGSQWTESIIKSEAGFVYGVDTIAKKIWRVKGQSIELISDFKINKFLIDNISLGERELSPIIGLKNVKTHYNNNKKDIIFTFYDDIYKDEEKVWSLCYNELMGAFITFYSWLPSYSENIDTKFFTFDRNTSKYLALLGKCNYSIPENTGVLVDNPILDPEKLSCKLYYKNPINYGQQTILNPDGTTYIRNSTISIDKNGLVPNVKFRLEKDHWGNYKKFKNLNNSGNLQLIEEDSKFLLAYNKLKSTGFNNDPLVKALLDNYNLHAKCFESFPKDDPSKKKKWLEDLYKKYLNIFDRSKNEILAALSLRKDFWNLLESSDKEKFNNGSIKYYILDKDHSKGITSEEIFKRWLDPNFYTWAINTYDNEYRNKVYLLSITPYIESSLDISSDTNILTTFPTETVAVTTEELLNTLTTDFYLHGQAGIFNVTEDTYPTYWYGEFHPFEFEFIVNENLGYLKIFSNLVIISNKAEPESLHFEIEGDNYDFSSDKRAMYFRQEATKELYLNLGSDMLFDRKYTDVVATKNSLEQYYRGTGQQNTEGLAVKTTYMNKYPVENTGLVLQVKSSIFPLYYERIDTYNEIYHIYREMIDGSGSYDFKNLSGSEIKWNRDLNLFNVVTHIKNSPMDLVGRLRGNSRYKEGKWNILIPSIIFNQKNEAPWQNKKGELHIPPIVINSSNIPKDLPDNLVDEQKLPNIYSENKYTIREATDLTKWTSRKETLIRDKWIKIRVRYSGKNLAIIHSLMTLYNISLS